MSSSQQPYATPTRPAFAPLQSSNSGQSSTYSSTSSLASQASISAPLPSPSTSPQHQHHYGSLNQQAQQSFQAGQQQQQQQPQQQRLPAPQRHPSFEYQPNRAGAGQTAAETQGYLNQAALLAEAAKRAQMACVMRDINEMEL